MNLIRKHLMIEGHIEKTCLVKILEDVTRIYSKWPLISCRGGGALERRCL